MSEGEPQQHLSASTIEATEDDKEDSIAAVLEERTQPDGINSSAQDSKNDQGELEIVKVKSSQSEDHAFKETLTSFHEYIGSDEKLNETSTSLSKSKSLSGLNEASAELLSKSLSHDDLSKTQSAPLDDVVTNSHTEVEKTKVELSQEMRQKLRNKLIMERNKRFSLESPSQTAEVIESWKKTLSNKL